jgi:hypothetical protein
MTPTRRPCPLFIFWLALILLAFLAIPALAAS